mgnify:FL=1
MPAPKNKAQDFGFRRISESAFVCPVNIQPPYLQGDKMEDQEEQLVLMVKETDVPQTNPYNLSTNSSTSTEEVPGS